MQTSARDTSDYRKSLRAVGIVLVAVGVIDIAWMMHCVRAGMGYKSSFNIFAVIAGILLCRGSLKTARVVASSSAFFLGAFIFFPLLLALLLPPDLVWAYLRLRPLSVAQFLVPLACLLALLAWVYCRLTARAVLAAIHDRYLDHEGAAPKPKREFMFGVLLAIVLTVVALLMPSGSTAERAKLEARQEVGEGYKLYFSGSRKRYLPDGGTRVEAFVTAYNRHEIRDVEVSWER
jgi:hypothetical protein